MNKNHERVPNKSNFIIVLSSLSIALGCYAIYMCIIQFFVMHHKFLKEQEVYLANQLAEQATIALTYDQLMIGKSYFSFLFLFIFSATLVVAAIALLKKMNWARILFIILMFLGIAWIAIELILQFTYFGSMQEISGANALHNFGVTKQTFPMASLIMAVGISALFGFIIKKLFSQKIKDEFI